MSKSEKGQNLYRCEAISKPKALLEFYSFYLCWVRRMCNFLFLALFTLFLPCFSSTSSLPSYHEYIDRMCWSSLSLSSFFILSHFLLRSFSFTHSGCVLRFTAFHRSAILRLLLLLCLCSQTFCIWLFFSLLYKMHT